MHQCMDYIVFIALVKFHVKYFNIFTHDLYEVSWNREALCLPIWL